MERSHVRQLEELGEYLFHADLDIVYREGPAVGYPGRSREEVDGGEFFFHFIMFVMSFASEGARLPLPIRPSQARVSHVTLPLTVATPARVSPPRRSPGVGKHSP